MRKQAVILGLNFLFTVVIESAFAQSPVDSSSAHLNKLNDQYEYYFFQNKKPDASTIKKNEYQKKMASLAKEITAIHQQKTSKPVNPDSIIYDLTSFFMEFPAPAYPYESNTFLFNGSVMFLGTSYSTPLIFSVERAGAGKLSFGVYAGRFTENNRSKKKYPESQAYYSLTKKNYAYNYILFGARASYHFYDFAKPVLGFNPVIFDPYVSIIVGYNKASNVRKYLSQADTVYEPPKKAGINIGLMGGVRYMMDEHLGLFLEAGYSRIGYLSVGLTYRML
jgi:hypothetical protein